MFVGLNICFTARAASRGVWEEFLVVLADGGIVRVTRAEHSRRFLSLNYAIEYVTTHLQEIPQRIR